MDHHRIFGTGKLDELTNRIKELKRGEGLTGVVVGIHSLKSNQLMNLEKLWGLPVYDRWFEGLYWMIFIGCFMHFGVVLTSFEMHHLFSSATSYYYCILNKAPK